MRFYLAVVACLLLAVAGACGAGPSPPEEGEEPFVEADLSIITNSFPAFLTGDEVDIVFDLLGGCDGPYNVILLNGQLPDGLMLDDAVIDDGVNPVKHRHHMKGILCLAGAYDFTIRITDVGCSMPKVATRQFSWTIGIGPLRIVKSIPQMIRVGDYQDVLKWPGIDVLPPQKINTNPQIGLIATGGVGPYTVSVIDDPADPDDNGLPQFTAVDANTHVISGSPTQFGPNGRPWRISFQVTDSQGAMCICKLQWPIIP